jgi:cytoskeletal protein RodZ
MHPRRVRKELRFALAAALVIGLVALFWWQSGRRREVERRREVMAEATAAMKALNAADETFPAELRAALATVAVDAAVQPGKAAQTLEARVIPMFDAYLTTLDRAVAGAGRVLAIEPDEDVRRNVARIVAKGATMRTMRDALAALPGRVAAGATSDEIARELQAIGLAALRSSTVP